MKTLFDLYMEIDRSYYDIIVEADQLFISENECRKFIDKHFSMGRKEGAVHLPYRKNYKIHGKHSHTVSLYLMSLCLKDKFEQILESKIFELTDLYFEYEYVMFLTCLYHDFASCIEDEKFKSSISKFKHTIYNFSEDFQGQQRFNKSTIHKYYKYMAANGKNEHGIIAGYTLFDLLYRNFMSKTKGHNWDENPTCYKDELCYKREQIPLFAYISDAIICHNIWMAYSAENSLEYKRRKMFSLIINSPRKKLNINDFPLHFILCLLDSIEPIKRFDGLSALTVLENIFLHVENNALIIGCTPLIKNQPEYLKWHRNIMELSKWMNVEFIEDISDKEFNFKKIRIL